MTRQVRVCNLCGAIAAPVSTEYGAAERARRFEYQQGWRRFKALDVYRFVLDVCPTCVPVASSRDRLQELPAPTPA